MYRKDLVEAAGMTMPDNPTWGHVADVAAAIHDGDGGVYGICLRGKPGWGDNTAFLTTMANSFGARWFDENWMPQLDSPAWNHAVSFYVDLLTNYGPPGSSANSFNEILALFNEGRCGMWIDATIAASFISDPRQSKVADRVAFAQAPVAVTHRGANWLWAWALAVPAGTKLAGDAKKFVEWATSKAYIELVAATNGWGSVPTGTRQSTYDNPNFQAAAVFADAELAGDPLGRSLEQHPGPHPVHRCAVCGDSGVPGDRNRGRPADERGPGGQRVGRRGPGRGPDRSGPRDEEGRVLLTHPFRPLPGGD